MIEIIAEIGINHNGDRNIIKQLIDGAKKAGCNAVKFQKRTIDSVYTKEELDKPRESPWGTTTREQKIGLELKIPDYEEINKYCEDIPRIMLANKEDLVKDISIEELKTFGLKINAKSIIYTSAKLGTNVDKAFKFISELII